MLRTNVNISTGYPWRFVGRRGMRNVRLAAAFVGLLAGASTAVAQQPDLGRCLAIADLKARVQCYDELAKAQQRSFNPATLPQGEQQPDTQETVHREAATPTAPIGVAIQPRKEFGLSEAKRESLLPKAYRQLDSVTAQVTATKQVGAGHWQFMMQDGSTWRTTESPRLFRPPVPGDTIRIRRGTLGSYYLDADRQPGVRVKRVS